MIKTEIIREVATVTGNSIKVTADVVDAFLIQIQKLLAEGGTAEFIGFGNFKVVDKEERKGINLQTKEEIVIPAHKTPRFAPSKVFKEIVNGVRPAPQTKKAPATAEADS